jgi:two-component system, sensor histidine kinase PdtaS
VTRILSIAAVHETLGEQALSSVDLKEVLERVARHVRDLTPGGGVVLEVTGDSLRLPSRAATSLALAASELVQNALKHAFAGRDRGRIDVNVRAGRPEHVLSVVDDGIGAGAGRAGDGGLGLEIVRTLVTHDLGGRFEVAFSSAGVRAEVRFPAAALDGGEP